MEVIVWLCIIGIFALPVLTVALGVSAVRGLKREQEQAARRAAAAAEQERAYLSTLTDQERLEYHLRKAAHQQAQATKMAGLAIAAAIGWTGAQHHE